LSLAVTGYDAAGFEAAWRSDWTGRLTQARAGLTAVLTARQSAVLAGDETAFLRTVDTADPTFLAEERAWFADLSEHPVESLALEGQIQALRDDGSLLAQVLMRYRLAGQREASVTLPIVLSPDGAGYRWAGLPFETLQGEHAIVRYPAGQEQVAREVLSEAEAVYDLIATDLWFTHPIRLVVKLYDDAWAFRTTTRLSLPAEFEEWTAPGEATRLLVQARQFPTDRRRALTRELVRQFLFWLESNVSQDSPGLTPTYRLRFFYPPGNRWFYEGIALFESGRLSPGDAQVMAARYRSLVVRAAEQNRLFPLTEMPDLNALTGDELDLARAQAWDAVRYLADNSGVGLSVLLRLGRGLSGDDAAYVASNLPLDFEADWRASAARGHADPAWVSIAWRFDEDAANARVIILAGPSYAGRQTGSPGDQAAARYIAAMFATYGLTPAGDDGTYLQHVPISYTVMLDKPSLTLIDQRQARSALTYRRDFLAVLREGASGGTVESAVVWVRDAAYEGMRLDGKIALRRPEASLTDEIRQAVEHGAGALILLGNRRDEQLLGKDPLPVSAVEGGIPVLEITEAGLERLLAAGGHSLADLNNSPPALPLSLRMRLEVPLSTPVTVSTTNVLGLLPGADPDLRHEVIIIGAHHDHVGDDPGRVPYPGANDNASGVGVLLEIARLWQETGYRPSRTVLFAAWGAQEPGEVGSSFYVAHPTFPLTDTVALFQLDAVGGGFAGFRLEAQGNQQREGLLLWTLDAAADQVEGRFILGKTDRHSDERPFQEAGIPAVLLTWVGSSEDNLPGGLDYEVDPYKLGVTGRTVTLALMMLAR